MCWGYVYINKIKGYFEILQIATLFFSKFDPPHSLTHSFLSSNVKILVKSCINQVSYAIIRPINRLCIYSYL